ncbi:iron chaperone [Demequina zhanjiangensis]|uniref:DUF1801 domain-containing protein n=1 Tax=Demequina zhanjiangensis TaxID=3051659 RepID=A0ABT8FYX3_9MICO|nr:DUF1801 domain-containing protein [Demequina sp. SYSU T00b26]MDN4472090.1 DUF1801 domain-containing protein [Demequina sp. SYSU T00b26]
MTAQEIDEYLSGYDGEHRSTMAELRALLEELLPDAEPCLSYGAPAYRVGGKLAAGFSAAKAHVTFFPHSGTVLGSLDATVLDGFRWSKGAVQIPLGEAPPRALIATVVEARLAELA